MKSDKNMWALLDVEGNILFHNYCRLKIVISQVFKKWKWIVFVSSIISYAYIVVIQWLQKWWIEKSKTDLTFSTLEVKK